MDSTRTNREYLNVNLEHIMAAMHEKLKRTAEVTCSPLTRVRSLLEKNKWDEQRTMMEHNYDQKAVEDPAEDVDECPLCICPIDVKFTISECNHQCCYSCAEQHIHIQVTNRSKSVECFHGGCAGLIDDDSVIEMLTDMKLKESYRDICTTNFILDSREYVHCPGTSEDTHEAKCSGIIHLRNPPMTLGVHCEVCSTCFCTKCANGYHEPVTCQIFREWCSRDEEFVPDKLWVRDYCKCCPNCRTFIEKNQGCMHMTCTQCKHEFCWNCFGEWKTHGNTNYGCNKPQKGGSHASIGLVEGESEADLERYKIYHDKYIAHQESERNERKHVAQIKLDLKQLLPDTDFGNTIQNQALPALAQGRRISMFSHVFAYFLKVGTDLKAFDLLLNKLDAATVNLSSILEGSLRDIIERQSNCASKDLLVLEKAKQELIGRMKKSIKNCNDRIQEVTKHIYDGYDYGHWRFEEKAMNPMKEPDAPPKVPKDKDVPKKKPAKR